MEDLNADIRRTLIWLRDNPHSRSRWMVGKRPPRNEPAEKWTHLEVSGPNGSINIPQAVNKAMRGLITGCTSMSHLYQLTEQGHAFLAAQPKD